MAYLVLNGGTTAGRDALLGVSRAARPFLLEASRDRPGRAARVLAFPHAPYTWTWPLVLAGGQVKAMVDFLAALGHTRDAFLVLDTADARREDVTPEPAVGDGARVTFALPTAESSPEWPLYPMAGTVEARIGSPSATTPVASVDQDARTVTLAVAPGIGVAVRLAYTPLRLVRLAAPMDEQRPDPAFLLGGLELHEVFRD